MKLFNQVAKFGAVLGSLVVGSVAFAQTAPAATIDLTPITNSFSAASVITAVMAVAATLAAIYAAMTAAKMALRWIRGG